MKPKFLKLSNSINTYYIDLTKVVYIFTYEEYDSLNSINYIVELSLLNGSVIKWMSENKNNVIDILNAFENSQNVS